MADKLNNINIGNKSDLVNEIVVGEDDLKKVEIDMVLIISIHPPKQEIMLTMFFNILQISF